MIRPGSVGVLCLALILVAAAAAAKESHVRATLVADPANIQAGVEFVVGVLFEPDPGWHIYWSNPGEAGLSTEIRFDLPSGFKAGEIGWPLPVEFEQPGGIIGYGYKEDVVLAASVTPAAIDGAKTPVSIEASWLACKDVCVLGSATLSAELPFSGSELERSRRMLAAWRESLPDARPSTAFELSTTGGPVTASEPTPLTLWLRWAEDEGGVEVFPDPGPGLKTEGLRVQSRGGLTRVDLTVTRIKTSSAPASVLPVLVVHRDSEGDRHGSVAHVDLQ